MEYGAEYFAWQKQIGEFGGQANLFKFTPFLQTNDVVLDFGCGGGYLLHNLQVAEKAGIEINEVARQQAQSQGLTIYPSIEATPDNYATLIISNHTLEHVECPLDSLRDLLPKLRAGGRMVFVVPHQKPDEAYHPNDVNQHLYTWNPMTLGNLFKAAGYVNIKTDVIRHAWKLEYRSIYKRLGQQAFDLTSRAWSYYKKLYQIRAYAEKAQ